MWLNFIPLFFFSFFFLPCFNLFSVSWVCSVNCGFTQWSHSMYCYTSFETKWAKTTSEPTSFKWVSRNPPFPFLPSRYISQRLHILSSPSSSSLKYTTRGINLHFSSISFSKIVRGSQEHLSLQARTLISSKEALFGRFSRNPQILGFLQISKFWVLITISHLVKLSWDIWNFPYKSQPFLWRF